MPGEQGLGTGKGLLTSEIRVHRDQPVPLVGEGRICGPWVSKKRPEPPYPRPKTFFTVAGGGPTRLPAALARSCPDLIRSLVAIHRVGAQGTHGRREEPGGGAGVPRVDLLLDGDNGDVLVGDLLVDEVREDASLYSKRLMNRSRKATTVSPGWTRSSRSCQPGRFMRPRWRLSPCGPVSICSYLCR